MVLEYLHPERCPSRKVREYREAKRMDVAAAMPEWTDEERRDLG